MDSLEAVVVNKNTAIALLVARLDRYPGDPTASGAQQDYDLKSWVSALEAQAGTRSSSLASLAASVSDMIGHQKQDLKDLLEILNQQLLDVGKLSRQQL